MRFIVNVFELQTLKSRPMGRLSDVVAVHVWDQNFGKLPKLSRLVFFGSVRVSLISTFALPLLLRSAGRRVGKGGRTRWSPDPVKNRSVQRNGKR